MNLQSSSEENGGEELGQLMGETVIVAKLKAGKGLAFYSLLALVC